jgi:hypothetical protein
MLAFHLPFTSKRRISPVNLDSARTCPLRITSIPQQIRQGSSWRIAGFGDARSTNQKSGAHILCAPSPSAHRLGAVAFLGPTKERHLGDQATDLK